ncbi:MAG: hypothetical protein ICV60_18195 [Pyrinomonadaceae bacterium]|nr:hypothetical protein [Pyrinomonadaceae bacterium]
MPVTKQCERCEGNYLVAPRKANDSRFCSRACQQAKKAVVKKICAACGKEYEAWLCRAEHSTYCSMKCRNKGYESKALQGYSKRCNECRGVKSLSEFSQVFHRGKLRYRSKCRACLRACHSSEQVKERQKLAYLQDRERRLDKNKEYIKVRTRELRAQIINSYGGKCVCCGESTLEFLAIDHIFDDGAQHRRESKLRGLAFYNWLIKQGCPKTFQLLCHNCNTAKAFYATCPHKTDAPTLKHGVNKNGEAMRRHVYKLRIETFAAYGGQCACCGESALEFLAIDHVNGGGSKQRRELKRRGVNFYRWLKKQGFPQGEYQALCHNCNMAKGFYGECPHGRIKERAA